MSEPSESNRPDDESFWQTLARRRLLLLPESLWFLLVSIGDIVLTYTLLVTTAQEHTPFRVAEGNPVAGYILDHWGIEKLIYFKFGMVAFVITIAEIVATRKHETGRMILRFGTLVVGAVVLYSVVLLILARRVA